MLQGTTVVTWQRYSFSPNQRQPKGSVETSRGSLKLFLLPTSLTVATFWFYVHLSSDGPNLFHTEQIWDFSHARNHVQWVQIWFSPREREEMGHQLQFSRSLVCTAPFPDVRFRDYQELDYSGIKQKEP